jgi:hypothetical protein
VYPGFQMEQEMTNPKFKNLLMNGVDVKTAFEVIHHDEILGGAMQYTARKVSEKLVNAVRNRTSRPAENGMAGRSGNIIRPDVHKLSRKDREQIERRVLRGETIRF